MKWLDDTQLGYAPRGVGKQALEQHTWSSFRMVNKDQDTTSKTMFIWKLPTMHGNKHLN